MDFFEDNPVELRKVLDMLTVANEFCFFLEKCENYPTKEVWEYLLKISPLLYLKGALLPVIQPNDEDYQERFVTAEQWQNIHASLMTVFGDQDPYEGHFFNEAFDNEANTYSLAENFSDIYQDLKDFVMLYQKRTITSSENSVSQCYRLYVSHWGPRILESLPRLHQLVFSQGKPNTIFNN
ncbi:MAG: DUF5063 domain-containing protein [Bacteroidetes bacterium]|nr:DUF5063 domain-containing protein [Bacteroidota bacterium]